MLKNFIEVELEYKMSENIFPLPCDQRYRKIEINYVIKILECLRNYND